MTRLGRSTLLLNSKAPEQGDKQYRPNVADELVVIITGLWSLFRATFGHAKRETSYVGLYRDVTDCESVFESNGFRHFFTNLNPTDLQTHFF